MNFYWNYAFDKGRGARHDVGNTTILQYEDKWAGKALEIQLAGLLLVLTFAPVQKVLNAMAC